MNLKKYVQYLEDHKIISAKYLPEGALVVSMTKKRAFSMEAERFHIHLFTFESRKRKAVLSNPELIKTNLLQDDLIIELFKYYKL